MSKVTNQDAYRVIEAAMRYLPPEIVRDIKRGIDRDAAYTDQYIADLRIMQQAYKGKK